MTSQQILIEPFHSFLEGQELHSFTMARNGMIDQLNDLFRLNPTMRVKYQIENPLLLDGDVQRHFQVTHGVRIVRLLKMIGRPVTGNHAGKFPAQLLNHIRIGIVLDQVHKAVVNDVPASQLARNVLAELLSPVGIHQLVSWDRGIISGVDREDRRIELQEFSVLRGLVEDL